MLKRFSSTSALLLTAGLAAALAVSSPAHAEDAPKPKKGLTVTVEDNDVVAAEEAEAAASQKEEEPAPKKKRKKRKEAVQDAPGDDASEAEIDAYLRELNSDVRDTAADLKAARRADDADEVDRLDRELRDKKELLRDEKDRLTTTEPGLVAGGAVLTAFGGIALVTSLVLLITWPLTAVDGHVNDEYGWGSLGCVIGGTVGLSAGIPMIVAGTRRTPRGGGGEPYYDEASLAPIPAGPKVGLSFTIPF